MERRRGCVVTMVDLWARRWYSANGESIADKGRDYGAWAREATVQRMMEPRWGTATVDGGGDVDGGRSIDEGVRGRW